MTFFHSMKRNIPTIPDWVLSGLLLVLLVWLIVLTVEFSELAAGTDIYNSERRVYVAPLYAPGKLLVKGIGITLPRSDSWMERRMKYEMLCLAAWSPVHFIIGALFTTSQRNLGIAFFILNLMVGCMATLVLVILSDL